MSIYIKTTKQIKKCAHCGNNFEARNVHSKCCSKSCLDKNISEIRKQERRKVFIPLPDKKCLQCGDFFTPKLNTANFCSDPCRQRHKYLKNRDPAIVTGEKLKLRGRAQSPEHIASRAASMAANLARVKRDCVKCGDEFTPTSAAQRYCSGRCWQSAARTRKPPENRVSIPKEQYSALMESQCGRCAICGCESGKNNRGDKLAVDHCHNTGKIRGLLCHKCNTAIGLMKDDRRALQAAIEYLSR